MTPQEKAKELVDKYIQLTDGWVYGINNWNHKIQCALIAVDEILVVCESEIISCSDKTFYYWQQVKQELEKYFKETPREKVLEDWEKSRDCDNVGITVEEFLLNTGKQKYPHPHCDEACYYHCTKNGQCLPTCLIENK